MISTPNSFFGLKQGTFSTTPEPGDVFKPIFFRTVLSQIADGFRKGGTIAIISGEAGTGKTTLCHYLVNKLPSHIVASVSVNPLDSCADVLKSICDELDIQYPRYCNDETVLVNQLQEFLVRAHARDDQTFIILDNAQYIGYDLYQHLDLLTHSDNLPVIKPHCVLTGPEDLIDCLKSIGFDLDSSDEVIQCKLAPMNRQDTKSYIHHRLTVGGATSPIFTGAATALVYRYAKGNPRSINLVCDHSLGIAKESSEHCVSHHTVKQAIGILSPPTLEQNPLQRGITIVSESVEILANGTSRKIDELWRSLQTRFSKVLHSGQQEGIKWIHSISWNWLRPTKVIGQKLMAINGAATNAFNAGPTPSILPQRNVQDRTDAPLDVDASELLVSERMVIVPNVTFTSAYTGKEITVNGFLLDQTPVTNEEYACYIEETGNAPPKHWWNKCPPSALANHPVVNVSYDEADRFAQWCGKRLPTASEWEAATRRPKHDKFLWSDDWQAEYCNCPKSGLNTTVAVDSNPEGKSVDGCLDLVGNVWEWTDGGSEGSDLESGYTWVFGGSYRHQCVINGAISRSMILQMNRYAYVGFRCAKELS